MNKDDEKVSKKNTENIKVSKSAKKPQLIPLIWDAIYMGYRKGKMKAQENE